MNTPKMGRKICNFKCISYSTIFYSYLPFFLCENGRSFMFGDLLVRVHANNQLLTECLGLAQRIGMSKVNHIVAVAYKINQYMNYA